ncbi:hypothetical protein D3C81_2119580 [compost metagenome]
MHADRGTAAIQVGGQLATAYCIAQRLGDALIAFEALVFHLLAQIAQFLGVFHLVPENFVDAPALRVQLHAFEQPYQQLMHAS